MSRTLTALCCAALVSLVLAPLASAQNGQAAAPANNSIILLQTITHTPDGVHYRAVSYGTAFVVDPQGLAITNSHVVYTVQHDPAHYWLLAILGHEFYGARIVCASRLPDDPTKPHAGGLTLSRDVAEIALTEPAFPFAAWGERIAGTFSVLARRHEGPLPTFPSLALGPAPREGEAITVTGYSRLGPIPELYTLSGQVSHSDTLRTDGTPVFTMTFTSPPRPGGSGSPVLDAQGRVIGIFTWYGEYRPDLTTAQSASALAPACR
jgi:V8-like Glu-specific endopeptidase